MKQKPPKVRFILNEPRNPKNIGAAARGMANFGFWDMAVVNPYSAAWRETRSAVNAHEVVTKAKKYDSLKAALRSTHVVIGTSAGSRRTVQDQWIDVDELKMLVHKSLGVGKKVAILFGSERSGLSNEDMGYCHYLIRLPTSKDCPSMNLSQAVAVLAYTIRLENVAVPRAGEKIKKVSVEHLERLVEHGLKACNDAGLLKGWDKDRSRQRLRKALYRWDLTDVDVAMLHGIFSRMIKKT